MADRWSIGFAVCALPVLVAFAVHEGKRDQRLKSEREQRHVEMQREMAESHIQMEKAMKGIELLKERSALMNDLAGLAIDVAAFKSECANLESWDWSMRKCEIKRKTLESKSRRLTARNDDLVQRAGQLYGTQAK